MSAGAAAAPDGRRHAGRGVVVTGARRGLGRAIAQHFLDHGAVVGGLSRGPATIEHANYRHVEADIRDADAVRRAFLALARDIGHVDVLINNAGVLAAAHAILMPASAALEMVQTNLLGTLYASREAAKVMRRSGGGRIVNISSMAVPLEEPGDSVYAATKAAVTTMAGVLAREFSGFNITCNTVGVTAIETDMLNQIPREKIDAVVRALPIPRYAEPDDVFNVIDFLVSERSGYITAQTIYLGGVH